MGYKLALEAAGWNVHAFERFGCYSGTWLAVVSKGAGPREVIRDTYGSCGLCDTFTAEFEDTDEDYDPTLYQLRLKAFGERYTALPLALEYMNLAREVDADGYADEDEGEILMFVAKHAREALA